MKVRSLLLVTLALVAGSALAAGQSVTTGSFSGTVRDQQEGALRGATVSATSEATGTVHQVLTDDAGRFQIPNVRVGGPYLVRASFPGFVDQREPVVFLGVGEDRRFRFTLAIAAVNEVVVVSEPTTSVFDAARAGTADYIPLYAVDTLPTVQRSLAELVRVSPHVSTSVAGSGDAVLSIAGRNSRYNNIQIDGSVYNDVFGLSASGAPGGAAGAQPVSLDVVHQVQLVVAPYDVRQGSFSGGGVNIVTKSGGQAWTGTGFVFGRGDRLVGALPSVVDRSQTLHVSAFRDLQSGLAVGGPLIRGRSFVFASLEADRRSTPTGFSISGTSGQPWGDETAVREVLTILRDQYGWQGAGLDEVIRPTDSDKRFIRFDLNLSQGSRLAVRVNDLNGRSLSGGSSNTVYRMPDAYAWSTDRAVSALAQLNTASARLFNELRVGWQQLRATRTAQPDYRAFPAVLVDIPSVGSIAVGTDGISQANGLDQDLVEVSNDLTWARGAHAITAGVHNEFFAFENAFVQNLYGNYRFSSPDQLRNGTAQSFARVFPNSPAHSLGARFAARQHAAYIGDRWYATPRLTLIFGVRVDVPRLSETPRSNPIALAGFGFATDVVPTPAMWSARGGFTRALGGDRNRSQLRGGAGLFAGRPAYVWLSNQFANTGLEFTSVVRPFALDNRIPFVADPHGQPNELTGAGLQTINVIDPRFEYPQVLRSNLAYDRALPLWGLVASAEVVLSKVVRDIRYDNLNYVATGQLPDGRPSYAKKLPTLNDVILLTNTTAGYQWSASVKVDRPFARESFLTAAYLFNRTQSVNDGTSNIAASNWGNTFAGADGINDPALARSIYDTGHRVVAAAALPLGAVGGFRATASMFYSGQSGHPYVLVFLGDPNRDGRTPGNDIVFVPASSDQVIVRGGTWEQLDAYLRDDPSTRDYRGGIPPRGAGRSPWVNQLDARLSLHVPTRSRARVELTADVVNVLNLLNRRWGHVYFPSANGPMTISYGGIDAASGKLIYNIGAIAAANFPGTFVRDDLRSRWQARFGARVRF